MNEHSVRPSGDQPRRWLRRAAWLAALGGMVLVIAFFALGGFATVQMFTGPSTPFAAMAPPPAPDYAKANAWLALPGRNGRERSTPPGFVAVNEATAPADVFFIHPTTYKGSGIWNAPFDARDQAAPLNAPVLLGQLSAFNGCCRLYAPRYRQASLAALKKSQASVALAYGDVAQAFRYYLAHQNHGRPFILASHSQGTAHAIRLLQEEVMGKPVQQQMVAAYLIGGYVPSTLTELGLPTCNTAQQTACVISYNTSQTGRSGARMIVDESTYWWRGVVKTSGQAPAICVNPLTWSQDRAAAAAENAGSLPFPRAPFQERATALPALTAHLTGAVCRNSLLDVDIASGAPKGFTDRLSWLTGSYHLNDYGIFYASLRTNSAERVEAWREREHSAPRSN